MINETAIPTELKRLKSWVTWRKEERDGKPTKIPYAPGTTRLASTTDPKTWGSFEQALADYGNGGPTDGIGFVFSNSPFCGVDLDHCLDGDGKLDKTAAMVLAGLRSYTERSPGGDGLHVIVKADLPPGRRRRGNVEMYDTGRYFTFTGDHWPGTPRTIEGRQAELELIHKVIFAPEPERPRERATPQPVDLDDRALIERAKAAKNGAKFSQLWAGDISGYDSDSEADLALCNLLAFWTGGDAARMDRLFRQSGLFRGKWEKRHYANGRTYGEGTLDRALMGKTEFYTPATSSRMTKRAEPSPAAERPEVGLFFDGKAFIPPRLGAYLERRRPFRNIANVKGDGNLHSYADGVFKRDGAVVVDKIAREVLGGAYRRNRIAETTAWLQANYTDPNLANKHAGLVNVANGMLNWRTGELLPHDPKYLSTIQTPARVDPSATCPAIDDFLLTTLPPDCIDLALEWIGYCLLPTAKYCKAVMCVGPAANGKSTFLGLLGAFLGQDNTANIPLHELDEHRFKRAMLQDKLANLFSDLDQRALKQSGYFKLIVSGDPIDAERKHQHPFTFRPFCKLVFSANKMPGSYDKSPAFYRRWLIIPFPNTFEGSAADPDMLEKITTPAELSGLLNKAIARLRTLEGRRGFAEPETVAEAMKAYKLTSDGMVAFLSECCRDAERGEWVGANALYNAYTSWTEDAKVKYTESRAEFNRRLQEFYPTSRKKRSRIDGKQVTVWYNGPVLGAPNEPELEPEQSELEL